MTGYHAAQGYGIDRGDSVLKVFVCLLTICRQAKRLSFFYIKKVKKTQKHI